MNISIDDAGFGHVLGGVFIGLADEELAGRSYVDEIPVEYFKEELFKKKLYLEKAWEIVSRGLKAMNVSKSEKIYCCSGYILSRARERLSESGFDVIVESHFERQAHFLVEGALMNYLDKIGFPVVELLPENSPGARARNFRKMLAWAKANPSRMKYVKTGWNFFQRSRNALG
ncbi:MAG: hypothetical protein ACUVTL_01275 [Thermoproteota archaeon]